MNRLLRLCLFLLATPLLSGCLAIVIDRAKFEADLPLAVPAMVPDSARLGSVHVAAAIRVSNGAAGTRGGSTDWKLSPIAGAGQVQVVVAPNLRMAAGVGHGGSPSAWTGPVFAARGRRVGLETELLVGTTHGRYAMEGHVEDSDEDEIYEDTLRAEGSQWHSWGQAAVRLHAVGSGPWVELRVLPLFPVGTIHDPKRRVSRDLVRWSVSSLSLGWTRQYPTGDLLTVGVRTVSVDGAMPNLQLVAALQHPLW